MARTLFAQRLLRNAVVGAVALTTTFAIVGTASAASRCNPRKSVCPTATTDTTAPSVSIGAPSSAATVSGTVSVAGGSSDNVAVATVEVRVDSGAWQTASGTTTWSTSVATGSYADGSHTLTARATDTSGNMASTSVSVTFSNAAPAPAPPADTTAPSVSISSPSNGATVSGTVSVAGGASDNAGVAKVEVSVDSGTWQTTSGTSTWSTSINTTGYATGTHTLSARATDTSGNQSTTSVSVSVQNPTSTSTSSAPDTQGTWVSPEGVHINVSSAGPWTIKQIYNMLLANALNLDRIGPTLTINVQDTYACTTTTNATLKNGVYTQYQATISLKGVNSIFVSYPDSVLTHEYGHAWTLYHLYMTHNGDWSAYLNTRWTNSNGSVVLATDSRLDSSYTWTRREIIADDYRLLFGSSLVVSEQPTHLNTEIPTPADQAGLRDWFLQHWAA